jgi:peptide/nickel transport system substrate-binding protein
VKSTRARLAAVWLLGATVASLAAASAAPPQGAIVRGGTYRVGWEQMTFDNLDPASAYADTYALFTNLLTRTLVGYNHVGGAAGSVLVPDLATRLPAPANGGRTYAFTLKQGIRFGPPVSREITSLDLRYALLRFGRLNPPEAPFFDVVRGFAKYRRGEARSVSGIRTPGPKTIVFILVRPTGDFLHRLTLPAASPVPREVARCFEGKPRAYGRNLVSSGPYMIEGARDVNIRSCEALRPMRGVSDSQLDLVRNPAYDPSTDSPAARESNPDRFVFLAAREGGTRSTVHLIGRVNAGQLDDAILYASPKVTGKYAEAARRRGRLRVNIAYWRYFVSMNVTQPPFDDVHVRRAMSWLLDRAAFRDSLGGPLAGPIPQHIIPDELLGGRLKAFAPFKTAGDHGSLARARKEMSRSRYRTRNGVCVAKACKRVTVSALLGCSCYAVGQRMTPLVQATAAKIGITFVKHSYSFSRFLDPSRNLAFVVNGEWASTYSDPANFVETTFAGTSIIPQENHNTSLVGITPARARRLGISGKVDAVPSVDTDLAGCSPLTGERRLDCYAALDRKLTTEIVPWIPFLWHSRVTILGPQVARWTFDQAAGTTGFAHVAVRR